MQYEILVLDLDGTLTNQKKEITPHTKEVLKAYQEAGGRIELASGRPTYGVAPLAEELELKKYHGYMLSFNGALIYVGIHALVAVLSYLVLVGDIKRIELKPVAGR